MSIESMTDEIDFQPVSMTVLERDLFAPGSLGRQFFPAQLEGRIRPADWLEIPVKATPLIEGQLSDLGISSISGLFNFEIEQLDKLPSNISGRILALSASTAEFLNKRYFLTPHQRLLRDLFGEPQGPLPTSYEEQALELDVMGALSRLNDRDRQVLSRKYRLDDWQPVSAKRAASLFAISGYRVQQRLDRAFRHLRHDGYYGDRLRDWSALPASSIGRRLGFIYRHQIPKITARQMTLSVDRTTAVELNQLVSGGSKQQLALWLRSQGAKASELVSSATDLPAMLVSFMEIGLSAEPSETAKKNLIQAINRLNRLGEVRRVFRDLLPYIQVMSRGDSLQPIRSMPLSETNLSISKREWLRSQGCQTVGDLSQNLTETVESDHWQERNARKHKINDVTRILTLLVLYGGEIAKIAD